MATAYSQPLQYTPYQEQWNKELLAKALQFKQDKYDTNRQVIKETIAQVSNIDLIKDQDAEYLYDRLQTVVNNLNTQGSGDLSLDSRADYLTGYVADVADQKVMNGYIGTRAYRNVVAEHNKYEETGEASDENLAYSLRDISAWANDGQIGSALPSGANTSYVKFTDLYEKYQEVAEKLSPDSYVVFEPFGGSGFTWYSQKNTELDANKLISAFNLAAESDPSIQDQLRVNSWTANRNVSDAEFVSTFKADGQAEKEALGTYIDKLKTARAKSKNEEEQEILDANIAAYENQVKQYDEALMMSDEQILANKESYQYLSYKNAYFTDLAGVFSYKEMGAPELVTDKGSLEMYKQQQENARNSANIASRERIAANKAQFKEDQARLAEEKEVKAVVEKILSLQGDPAQQRQIYNLNKDLLARNPQYAAQTGLLENYTPKQPSVSGYEVATENNLDITKIQNGDYSEVNDFLRENNFLTDTDGDGVVDDMEFESVAQVNNILEAIGNQQKGLDASNSYDYRYDQMLANGEISQKQYNELTEGSYNFLDDSAFDQFFNPADFKSGVHNIPLSELTVNGEDLNTINAGNKINELTSENKQLANLDLFIKTFGEAEGRRIHAGLTGKGGQHMYRYERDADGTILRVVEEPVKYDANGDVDFSQNELPATDYNYSWNSNFNEPTFANSIDYKDVMEMLDPATFNPENPNFNHSISLTEVEGAATQLHANMVQYALNSAVIDDLATKRITVERAKANKVDEIMNNINVVVERGKLLKKEILGFANDLPEVALGGFNTYDLEESIEYNTGNTGRYVDEKTNLTNFDFSTTTALSEAIALDNAAIMTAPKTNFNLSNANEQMYFSDFISVNQNKLMPLNTDDFTITGIGLNLLTNPDPNAPNKELDEKLTTSTLGNLLALNTPENIDGAIKQNAASAKPDTEAMFKLAMNGNASIITANGYHYIVAGYDTRDPLKPKVIGGKIPVGAVDFSQYSPLNDRLEQHSIAQRTALNNHYMERIIAPTLKTGETFKQSIDSPEKIVAPATVVEGLEISPEIEYVVTPKQEITKLSGSDVNYRLAVTVEMRTKNPNGKMASVVFPGSGGKNNTEFTYHPTDESGQALVFNSPSDFQMFVQENFNDDMSAFMYQQSINAAGAQAGNLNNASSFVSYE